MPTLAFLRQAALLLPSAFLLGVLLFLVTHGRQDPGFGTYPFFEQWSGGTFVATSPEGRFVEQSLVFFLPAYLVGILFILLVVMGERALFGPRPKGHPSAYRRAFGSTFAIVLLLVSAVLVFAGDRAAARAAPGALVAPLLVALAPFAAAALAVLPAAILAAPFALLSRAQSA